MKRLILKAFFLIAPITLIMLLVLFYIPPSESMKKYMLFAQADKNTLLQNTQKPRIIFIGGSNLSFGLDSKRIKDSMGINPINTGIHAGLGLKYMLSNSEKYIKENDIIIISPEYEQFYGDYANGSLELLSTVTDITPNTAKLLDYKQYLSILPNIPKYIQSKLSGCVLPIKNDTTIGIYDRKSFNSFGDAFIHWTKMKQKVKPYEKIEGNFNNDAITSLINFSNNATMHKAKVYIVFPCFQDLSYIKFKSKVKEVENKLNASGIPLISNPERYVFPDSLMYNSPYHLTKKGVDIRTTQLIEDLRKNL